MLLEPQRPNSYFPLIKIGIISTYFRPIVLRPITSSIRKKVRQTFGFGGRGGDYFPVTRQPPFPATADGNFFERGNKVATLLGFKLSFGSINLQSIKINPNGGSPSNSKVSKNFSLRLKTGKSFTISGRKVRLRFPVSVAKEKKITSVFIIKVQYYVTLIPWNTETGYWNLFCSLTRVISKVTLLASAAEAGFQEGSFSLFRHI